MNTLCFNPKFTYKNVKKQFKIKTCIVGAIVSSSYGITSGFNYGISSLIGTAFSFTYVNMLCDYVDNIEKNSESKHILVPVAMIVGETLWNNYYDNICNLDYLTTIVGFLSYKLALYELLYEAIKIDIKNSLNDKKNT